MFPFGINGAGSFRNRDRSDSDSLKNVQNRETFSGMALAADGRQNLKFKTSFYFFDRLRNKVNDTTKCAGQV